MLGFRELEFRKALYRSRLCIDYINYHFADNRFGWPRVYIMFNFSNSDPVSISSV